MLFFKPKPKSEELLPPPPPFPSMELDDNPADESGMLTETIKPEEAKTEGLPEEREFHNLVKEWDEIIKPLGKKENNDFLANRPFSSNKKLSKGELKQFKKTKFKQLKEKKTYLKIKSKKGTTKKSNLADVPGLKGDFDLEDADFNLPKELASEKEIELPDKLEELDIDSFGKELAHQTEKPKEIIEAENEIKDAIGKIKNQENPSLFRSLFAKRKSEQKPAEAQSIQEIPEVDDVSAIKNKINAARQALMSFDLGTAKKKYVEAMEIYNKIGPEEQSKVYLDIKELYSERKSAEQLKA